MADTKAAVEEVMRLEFDNAASDVVVEEGALLQNSIFLASDMNAVLALARARAQVGYKKHVLEGMNAE